MKEERGCRGESKVALGCQDVTCAFSLALSAFSLTFENIQHKIHLLYLTKHVNETYMTFFPFSKDVHSLCSLGVSQHWLFLHPWTFRKLVLYLYIIPRGEFCLWNKITVSFSCFVLLFCHFHSILCFLNTINIFTLFAHID